MDEVVLDGKTYVASRKAAQECGYAQDYVGQLSRKGFIDAKRVSGQWYVQLDSLKTYKAKAEEFKPEPPKYQPDPNVEATLNLDGKEFVSAARAAKVADYNQDYIAQLARAGKIPSKQMGNRWYVELASLLEHKKEKDALLRAVQADAVGLKRPQIAVPREYQPVYTQKPINMAPLMAYSQEQHKPLFPDLSESVAMKAVPTREKDMEVPTVESRIPIRVLKPITVEVSSEPLILQGHTKTRLVSKPVSVPRKSMFPAISWGLAFGVILIAVVGVGTFKRDPIMTAVHGAFGGSQTASVGDSQRGLHALIDKILTKEIIYQRK
jgi:hypothetical protein